MACRLLEQVAEVLDVKLLDIDGETPFDYRKGGGKVLPVYPSVEDNKEFHDLARTVLWRSCGWDGVPPVALGEKVNPPSKKQLKWYFYERLRFGDDSSSALLQNVHLDD